jgi:hypothetical protein
MSEGVIALTLCNCKISNCSLEFDDDYNLGQGAMTYEQ